MARVSAWRSRFCDSSVIDRSRATSLLLLGGLMALLTHVPLLGLFAPSLAALAYIHFCLEGLRRFRRGAVTTI